MTDTSPQESSESPESTRAQVKEQMKSDEAADVALAAVDEIAELSSEVERLQGEVKALQEQVLRRAAEFQNYRRRTDAELGQTAARGREDVITAVLNVYDDLRRSLDAAGRAAKQETPGPAYDALHEGVELVYKKFSDVLAQFQVEPIEAVGYPFDETLHDALMQQPSTDPGIPSGTVIAEIQPGYRMGDRILRHAKVIVAQ